MVLQLDRIDAFMLSEALTQYLDNATDVDDCDRDAVEVVNLEHAQALLDQVDAFIAGAAEPREINLMDALKRSLP